MISADLYTVSGEKFILRDLIHLEISSSWDYPADTADVLFPAMPALKGIELKCARLECVDDSKGLIFKGPVDEFITTADEKGHLSRIKARSLVANLLETEALPGTYWNLSIHDFFNDYLLPYGITSYEGPVRDCPKLVIRKGTCIWTALEIYAKTFFQVQPRVKPDGTLVLGNLENGNRFLISNESGIQFLSAELHFRRRGIIRKVHIKNMASGSYDRTEESSFAASLGALPVRYLHPSPDWLQVQTDSAADAILARGKREAVTIRIVLPESTSIIPGDIVRFVDAQIGNFTLYVAESLQSYDEAGRKQTLVLQDLSAFIAS